MFKKTVLKTVGLFVLSLTLACAPTIAFASDDAGSQVETSDWTEDEITNTFYIPKAAFHSRYDYEEYCKRMYNNGYMDSSYNWTDQAQDYINNPTKEKAVALDQAARELVEERVENGQMAPEDNPFLTYEEREEIKAAQASSEPSDEPDSEIRETEETNETEEISETEKEETEESKETEETEETESEDWEEPDSGNSIGKLVTAAIITLVVFLFYLFYRKHHM